MRFLARIMDDYYAEHGHSFFRRSVLAFVFGTIIGALVLLRSRREFSMSPEQMGLAALGIGVAVMIVGTFMNFSKALWQGGFLAKLGAFVVFLLGSAALIAFICFAASRFL